MKLNAFFDLLAYTFVGAAVGWVKRVVATERTSSSAYCAVAVGAAEAGVDANLLHTTAELSRDVCGIAVKTTIITPKIHVVIFCKDKEFLINRTNGTNRANRINIFFIFAK